MFRIAATSALLICLCTLAAASVEALYVAQPQASQYSLLTYNVNPRTAVATQVGQAITINANSIDPLTVAGNHFLYIWNATDVWVYATDAHGAPGSQPVQHLTFNFAYPVFAFVTDPDGKFAYAAYSWVGDQDNIYTNIILFTIDQAAGTLTNTGTVAGTFGPNPYIYLTNVLFGKGSTKLFAEWFDDGPHTSAIGYDYYAVNQTTGSLGAATGLYFAQTFECGSSCAIAISSTVSAVDGVCCGPGSGLIEIGRNFSQKAFGCEYELAFCSDDVAGLYLDPAGRNVVFGDKTIASTFVAHIDFAGSQLIAASTTIPGTPTVYFSPDERLLYTLSQATVGIYAFQAKTGEWTANTSLQESGNVTIASATLK